MTTDNRTIDALTTMRNWHSCNSTTIDFALRFGKQFCADDIMNQLADDAQVALLKDYMKRNGIRERKTVEQAVEAIQKQYGKTLSVIAD